MPLPTLQDCLSRLALWVYRLGVLIGIAFLAPTVHAQHERDVVNEILKPEIMPQSVALFQLRQYLLARVAPPPAATSAQQWTSEAAKIREKLLSVVYHGWPKEWVTGPLKVEDLGIIPSGKGYRLRKLRYEIIPGFSSTAILYEPEKLEGKVPAVLNVNGHDATFGKAAEYKQKRCINLAKRGMLALNLEWLGMGELNIKEDQHWFGGHMDLVGTHEVGLFYLAMRKGLDFLYEHPNADRNRIGMTGLSGGGWQTITLSALDERIKVSIPVAGFSSLTPRLEVREYGDIGDVEQSATDMFADYDYSHLAALMAPRPTLLTYNAEDNCCFRATVVKPLIFDVIRPFFKAYGKEDAFEWHENSMPGNHNYQLDNRQQSYRFFSKHFGMSSDASEIDSDSEVKTIDEFRVGLPEGNLTILALARKLAGSIARTSIPESGSARESWSTSGRTRLQNLIRHQPVRLKRAWVSAITKNRGIESKSLIFEMANGLSATGVWLKAFNTPDDAPAAIVLNDAGKQESVTKVAERLSRGEQVLALDLIFMGDSWKGEEGWAYIQIVHGTGGRALGLETAQLVEIARWLQGKSGSRSLRLEVSGMRNQVVASAAAALEPKLFSQIMIRGGISSLGYLLEKPVEYEQAADLFCLDLYKEFDVDRLEALAEPTRFSRQAEAKVVAAR